MSVASGIIPYQYEGTYPLRVQNHSVGYSGILFEQAMMVLTAETHRYDGSTPGGPQVFNKYINPNTSPIEFTPLPNGINLDGKIDGLPGAAAFIDYITDMRGALNALFISMSFDGGDFGNIKTDWLEWVGGISGEYVRNFARSEESPVGIITSTDLVNDLGASGTLLDIDLREVSFQPYSRIARLTTTLYKNANVGVSPCFPNFQNTDGNFVRVNSRDILQSLGGGSYQRYFSDINNGLVILDGDMFFSSTDFCLLPGTTKRTNIEGQVIHNAFTLDSLPGRPFFSNNNITVDSRASALLAPKPQTSQGYSIGAINSKTALPGLVLPSGTASFMPNVSYFDEHVGSGYYVFNDGLWIIDPIVRPSGLMLMNPFNGEGIWFRLADQTSYTDQSSRVHSFSSTVGLILDDNNDVVRMQTTGDTSSTSNDIRMGFFQYNKNTLDLSDVVNPVQDWTVTGASVSTPGALSDACFGGGQYIAYTNNGLGLFRNIYLFDSGFALVDSKFYTENTLIWIQSDLFGGGTFGGLANGSMVELVIDPDPSIDDVDDTGITYTIDTSVAAWPTEAGTLGVVIHDAQNISGFSNINDGIWFICQTGGTADKVVVFRGTLGATTIIPEECFIVDNLDPLPGTLRYQFLPITIR